MNVSLGVLCTFVNGGTPAKGESRYFTGDIPWITGADIQGPEVTAARSYITEDAIRSSATNRVPAGTVLLVTRTSVGKVATAGIELCFSQDITALVPDAGRLDGRFLMHFLRTKQDHLERVSRGATIRGVVRDDVARLLIPLPDLAEQRRIANMLDHVDNLRAKRRAAIAHLDRLARSIFLDMFGDPIANPKGWEVRKFGDPEVGTLERGISRHRPRNDPALLGGKYPLVQTGDVANSGGYIREARATYSDAGLKQSKLWPKGTLCITIAANIAKTGILTFDACFPDSVVGFTARKPEMVEFVRFWLMFLQRSLEAAAPESAQKNINLAILRDLDLPLPPPSSLAAFSDRVARLRLISESQHASLSMLHAAGAALQHRAFAGQALA